VVPPALRHEPDCHAPEPLASVLLVSGQPLGYTPPMPSFGAPPAAGEDEDESRTRPKTNATMAKRTRAQMQTQ
jgi:hypothetical protein